MKVPALVSKLLRNALAAPVQTLRRVLGGSVPSGRQQRREAAKQIAGALKADGSPLAYLDVGAAGARHPDWQWLLENDLIEVVAIDMVDEWSRRQPRRPTGLIPVKAALGENGALQRVFITRHPACSSCLRPNEEVLRSYPVREWFDVIREDEVTTTRFDVLAEEAALPRVEVAKIDVQGFEGQVLRGMGQVLDSIVCLEFECQVKELYCGQETFFDLYRMLTARDFVLRDLRAQGPFEGEAVEFNSFWARRASTHRGQQVMRLWELVNQLSPAPDFRALDAHQRAAYSFNE